MMWERGQQKRKRDKLRKRKEREELTQEQPLTARTVTCSCGGLRRAAESQLTTVHGVHTRGVWSSPSARNPCTVHGTRMGSTKRNTASQDSSPKYRRSNLDESWVRFREVTCDDGSTYRSFEPSDEEFGAFSNLFFRRNGGNILR